MTRVMAAIVLAAGLSRTAEAQPGRGSLASSYDLLRDHEQGETYPVGLSLSADLRVYRWLGAAVEVSRSNRSEDFRDTGGGLFVNGTNTLTFRVSDFGVISGLRVADLAGAVPEPATWAMLIVGFGVVAGQIRRRRRAGTYAIA